MDFDRIRTLTVTALFSDDVLFDLLVLNGGNAITLVYGYGSRASLDLDFSLERDFANPDEIAQRMFRALKDRFSSVGLVVLDERFELRPHTDGDGEIAGWGGYRLSFKLIERAKFVRFQGNLDAARRESLEVGPAHLRTFTVDFSKFEYCEGKAEKELDDYTIYVYTPAMLAIEKLRAICQQMPEYPLRSHRRPRARDFYDIHQLITKAGVDFRSDENMALLRQIFAAKHVPVRLIADLPLHREFHRPDWPAVTASVRGRLESFGYYFDFLVDKTRLLEALWII